jgi:hypothetical protein
LFSNRKRDTDEEGFEFFSISGSGIFSCMAVLYSGSANWIV